MRTAATFACLVLSFAAALGCGGMVVFDGGGHAGGGGGTGDPSVGGSGAGSAGSCKAIDCKKGPGTCSCETACMGPDLRADCSLEDDGMVVCECHYDKKYLGLCANVEGDLCSLPGGCCLAYLPE